MPDDSEAYHGGSVAAQDAAVVFGSPLYTGHVSQTYQVAVVSLSNHQAFEIFSGIEQSRHPNGELFADRFHAACGKFHILFLQCLFDIGDSDAPGCHGLSVEPDAHGVTSGTAHPDPGNAL